MRQSCDSAVHKVGTSKISYMGCAVRCAARLPPIAVKVKQVSKGSDVSHA